MLFYMLLFIFLRLSLVFLHWPRVVTVTVILFSIESNESSDEIWKQYTIFMCRGMNIILLCAFYFFDSFFCFSHRTTIFRQNNCELLRCRPLKKLIFLVFFHVVFIIFLWTESGVELTHRCVHVCADMSFCVAYQQRPLRFVFSAIRCDINW